MPPMNRPNRIVAESSADSNLKVLNGIFSGFSNQLGTPMLGVKGLQLNRINFVNSMLQLNDSGHLMFLYYSSSTQAGIRTPANLRCIRLLPSNYVPASGYSNFVRNRYWNSVTELVAALNQAAATGGDSVVFNPTWISGEISFSYDATTRKVSVSSASKFIAPAAADDPYVIDFLNNTGSFYGPDSGTYAITAATGTGTAQTYSLNNSNGNFQTGQLVTITGMAPAGYNVTNATITAATATQITVAGATTAAVTQFGSATSATAVNSNNKRPVMYASNTAAASYASATVQPYTTGQSLNARLGFALSYAMRGAWWSANSQSGCATSTGIPTQTTAIEADNYPILIGSQNINVYCNQLVGSGNDSRLRKNLLASVPLEQPSLAVNSYTLNSMSHPALTCIPEIYCLDFSFLDDYGNPFPMMPNSNVQLELSVWY